MQLEITLFTRLKQFTRRKSEIEKNFSNTAWYGKFTGTDKKKRGRTVKKCEKTVPRPDH